jgi:hypothetical protein
MFEPVHSGVVAQLRTAAARANRDHTAGLNAVVYGAMLAIAASGALVAIGGFGGIVARSAVWLGGIAAAAQWVAPHLIEVRREERRRIAAERTSTEEAGQRAVDLLLDEDAPDEERRNAAAFLVSGDR